MPTRRRFLALGRNVGLGLGGLVTFCGGGGSGTLEPPPARPSGLPPNIVLFIIDDLGAGDCGVCGSTFYRTPAIDRMAREGLRFTNGYSPSPLCSSSRAAIFTGKTPHRLGITGAIQCGTGCTPVEKPALPDIGARWQKVRTPSYLTQLPLGERTIAEYLREAGYATAHLGKWHLGGPGYSAATQGFDLVVGGGEEGAPISHFSPYGLSNVEDDEPGTYIADRLTRDAEAFVRSHASRPFFLSLSHYGVHVPLQAPDEMTAGYTARRDPRSAQQHPIYAGMIEKIDQSLGRLLDQIDGLGLAEHTLVIMTSDNGGLMLTSPDSYLRRVTSSGPFRGGKAHIYEGGLRVPMILRWPSQVPANAVSEVPACGTDLLPTALDLAGLPSAAVDGMSLRPLFDLQWVAPERALVWHFPHYIPARAYTTIPIDAHAMSSLPASALRRGRYKFVRVYGEGLTNAEPAEELYDVVADPGEVNSLATLYPEIVRELGFLLSAELSATGALIPGANPDYRESLDGWRAVRHAVPAISHGYLRVVATGNDPQILSQKLSIAEAFTARVRIRSTYAASIVLFWSTADKPTFSSASAVTISLAAGTAFVDLDFAATASASAPVRWLRLDTGTTNDIVDIDEIRLVAAADPARELQRWRFNGVTGLPIGGSWFAEYDTSVALGPGSLQVDLAGSAPTIVSPPVTLFASMTVRIRMRSTGAGRCALAWSLPLQFTPTALRSVAFDVPHDGAWHEHEIRLDEAAETPVQRLMLSLGSGTGIAEIDHIRVFDSLDSLVAVWDFGPGPTTG